MTDRLNDENKCDLIQAYYALATIAQVVDRLKDLTQIGTSNSPNLKYLRLNWNAGNSYLFLQVENFVETFNGFFDKFCCTGTKPKGDSQ